MWPFRRNGHTPCDPIDERGKGAPRAKLTEYHIQRSLQHPDCLVASAIRKSESRNLIVKEVSGLKCSLIVVPAIDNFGVTMSKLAMPEQPAPIVPRRDPLIDPW
jgi:hypothetical protein